MPSPSPLLSPLLLFLLLASLSPLACSSDDESEPTAGQDAGSSVSDSGEAGSDATTGDTGSSARDAGGTGDAGGGDSGTTIRPHPTGGASWAFLVYMVADNNLEPFGLGDLEEMAAVGSGPSFDIIVQVDRASDYVTESVGGLPDFTTTKRLRIGAGSITELADLGELNMGDPAVLSDFIQFGVTSYPADRYALVFWDHGGAWPGFGGDESTQDHDVLSLQELAQGISQGMTRAGLLQFSLIGFDACLMSTFETALTMKPFGEYLLASEELEPGHGWDYRRLALLRNTPATSPLDLGRALAAGYKQQAIDSESDKDVTLALTDLYALDPVDRAVRAFASALGSKMTAASAIGQERASTLEFGRAPDPAQSTHMVDLGDLATRLAAADADFAPSAAQVTAALAQVVLHKEAGELATRATGLTIYFPSQSGYYDAAYDSVQGIDAWRTFLKAYFEAQATSVGQNAGPRFTNQDHVASIEVSGGDIIVTGQLAAGDAEKVAAAKLTFGLVDTARQKILILGQFPATVEASGVVTASWDASILRLSQNTNEAYGYLAIEPSEGLVAVTIPFEYKDSAAAESRYAILAYFLDPSTSEIVQQSYYVFSEGGPGELAPLPGSLLYPLLIEYDIASGNAAWLRTSDDAFDAASEISLSTEVLPSGTRVYMEITVEDFAGGGDYVYFIGDL